MAKRLKFDESGDSDDLQALFDSIAGGPATVAAVPAPHLEVVPSPAVLEAAMAASDDDDQRGA